MPGAPRITTPMRGKRGKIVKVGDGEFRDATFGRLTRPIEREPLRRYAVEESRRQPC
jgi:hypothetical protein